MTVTYFSHGNFTKSSINKRIIYWKNFQSLIIILTLNLQAILELMAQLTFCLFVYHLLCKRKNHIRSNVKSTSLVPLRFLGIWKISSPHLWLADIWFLLSDINPCWWPSWFWRSLFFPLWPYGEWNLFCPENGWAGFSPFLGSWNLIPFAPGGSKDKKWYHQSWLYWIPASTKLIFLSSLPQGQLIFYIFSLSD